jgi:DNA recombination-dependent growth factor C
MGVKLIQFHVESANLPAGVIKKELDKTIAAIESRENRKIGSKEKAELRDNVEFDLLPQAFSKELTVKAYFKGNHLLIDSSSAKVIESLTSCFRSALGSLPIEPVTFNTSVFNDWLLNEEPKHFELTGNVTLGGEGEDKKQVVKFSRFEVDSDEIEAALENGHTFRSGEMKLLDDSGNEILKFTATESAIKSISFNSLISDESAGDNAADLFDSRLYLTVMNVDEIMGKLKESGAINE